MSKELDFSRLSNLIDNMYSDSLKSPFLRLFLSIINNSECAGALENSTLSISHMGKAILDNLLPYLDKSDMDFLQNYASKYNKLLSKKLTITLNKLFANVEKKEPFEIEESAVEQLDILHSEGVKRLIADNKFSSDSLLYSEAILALCKVKNSNEDIDNMLNSLVFYGKEGLEAMIILEFLDDHDIEVRLNQIDPKTTPSRLIEYREYLDSTSSEESIVQLFDDL